MEPAKILKIQDFTNTLQFYNQYLKDPQATSMKKDELRGKLESYINKRITTLNKKS